MTLFALKMKYEKTVENYLAAHLEDPSSQINETVMKVGANILSFYQTLCGKHLIFIIETPGEQITTIEQSIIQTAPCHFLETKSLG